MDTELARTFLAVIAEGNFINAAEHLHLTQSTVSSRIHSLEQQLGCSLFIRNRAGTTLTPAGRQFQKHAAMLVRTVTQARQDVGIPAGFRAALAIGGRYGLWPQLLLKWLPRMRKQAPDVSLRAEIGFEADLIQGLIEGRLDVGLMYTPQSRPGLKVELLLEERLVLVSSDPEGRPEPGPGYIYIDWGPEFYAKHSANFPDFVASALTANIGWLGIEYILKNGGSGYFPLHLLRPYLEDKRFTRLRGAPEFPLSAYAVYLEESDPELIGLALTVLRDIIAAELAQGG